MKKIAVVVTLLLAVLLAVPAATAHAQVGVAVGFGPAVVPVAAPIEPACAYGYYNYYPYACAPYGYYGPDWFYGGAFIGVGPWYHRHFGDRGGFYGRGAYGRSFVGDRGGYNGRGFAGRVAVQAAHVASASAAPRSGTSFHAPSGGGGGRRR